ncbi:regulator of microtubule dynamics protein 1-like isoform X1 [Plodia interpunctella]|uniref:regulator of microtubule dynamics protein 1-like isoform X1 n=1 Tax=Plodia interpunctella TaxID=58824 RepID=UPI002368146D|nr:regulator of microtubule dynamics protein 1-like isoform X1 [Plodia interpunctella]
MSRFRSSLNLLQLIRDCRHLYSRNFGVFSQFQLIHRKNILLSGLAFLWPTKTLSGQIAEKKDNLVPSIIETADKLFDNGHFEECYQILKSCNDKDIEIYWRISRVMYNMSKEMKYDIEYRKLLILEAYKILSEQVQNNYDRYEVHKWYALLLDAKSAQEGIKERIKQLENVRKHMDLAVTLNPSDATTLHMLGEWCFQITEMPWHQRKIAEVLFATPPYSTYEDALEYFLRAETAQPRFYSLNLLRLGTCYLKLNKEDQAKYYLKLAASYPAKSNDDHRANKEASELLKRLK